MNNLMIYQLPIRDIFIPEFHSKIYESETKRDKIEEIKLSIQQFGQKEPIILTKCQNHNLLIDGRLRLIAMSELSAEYIAAIYSPFDDENESLDDFILQHHIRKELSVSEKLREVIENLQIGKENSNKYIGIDKRREMVSKKLGKGFGRSSVIDLGNIIEYEINNGFSHEVSESVISGTLKIAEGKSLFNIISETGFTSNNEASTDIIKGFLKKHYDLNRVEDLICDFQGKNKVASEILKHNYSSSSSNYEIKQGSIFDVDLSNVTFDVIFSSPPYALQREYGDDRTNEIGVEKNVDEYIRNIADAFEKGYNQLSEKGSMFVNVNDTWRDGFSLNVIEKFVVEMENRGIRKVQMIHWEKPNPKPQGGKVHRYLNKFEYIIHFAKNKDYQWFPVGKIKKSLKVQSGCSEVGAKQKGYSIPSIITACHNLLSDNMIEGIDEVSEFTSSIKNNPMILKRLHEKGEDKHTATFNMLLPMIPLLSTMPRDRQGIVGDIFAGTSTTGEIAIALGHRFVGVELYGKNCETSARVLSQAEKKFQNVNLINELLENEIEYSKAA